ncbi:hypothetical protein BC939DRAFT_457386 [Gamsiella multidivaricata]|uniref:uncharacterized protein n=1 Tax=Gamsiella multidivaricata TaxID=101098 RepID=UPI002220A016|nr:uncharacterized protein BC939DRAFT_457386 [Gamsiella multidivaricata]KAI7820694.1 hypothetical protein BC939DRAFT_457386 [Gamsiella multidivaricata]
MNELEGRKKKEESQWDPERDPPTVRSQTELALLQLSACLPVCAHSPTTHTHPLSFPRSEQLYA